PQVEPPIHLLMQAPLQMLGDDFSQHHLFGEVHGPHPQCLSGPGTRAPPQHERQDQARDNFRSTHPNPPSAVSAISAAGTAPARICAVCTEATPRKMNTPSPPPPIAAAIVAVPIVVTVATRMPARIVGAASGSSTSQSSCRPVIPMAIADSRTARSTPRMPVSVFLNTGISE